ncbi:MAG: Hsp20/alpha crystallin family protein [Halobacteriaceae archaeon]
MTRRDPFDEIENALDRMGRQLERELGDPTDLTRGLTGGVAVDLRDAGEAYVLTADLPGYDTDDIAVELREETVHVEASRDVETETGDETYLRRERRREAVTRTIDLPGPVEESAVEAGHQNGVLTVTLPKAGADEGSTEIDIE